MGFRTILADPPWNEQGGGKSKRGADRHYPLLKTYEIPDAITTSGVWLPAEHAHLWMWATNNKLPDALKVIDELGFDYKTNVTWVKTKSIVETMCQSCGGVGHLHPPDHGTCPDCNDGEEAWSPALQIGLGQYLRGSHELLLFATRGKGQHESVWEGRRNIPSVIFAPRTKHSKKPVKSYELIESISKGPRLEMFARSGREDWLSWGNELDKTAD